MTNRSRTLVAIASVTALLLGVAGALADIPLNRARVVALTPSRPAQPPNTPSKVHQDVPPAPASANCPPPQTTADCTIDKLTTPCGERSDYKAACKAIFVADPTVKARYATPGTTKQFFKAN